VEMWTQTIFGYLPLDIVLLGLLYNVTIMNVAHFISGIIVHY